jgi:hypothetical protein
MPILLNFREVCNELTYCSIKKEKKICANTLLTASVIFAGKREFSHGPNHDELNLINLLRVED